VALTKERGRLTARLNENRFLARRAYLSAVRQLCCQAGETASGLCNPVPRHRLAAGSAFGDPRSKVQMHAATEWDVGATGWSSGRFADTRRG
jgi:hypothetical protein